MAKQTAVSLLCLLFLAGIATSALSIWIVGKVGLGLQVDSIIPAILASIAIMILIILIDIAAALIGFSQETGWESIIIATMAAFIVLQLASRIGRGIRVEGFWGAMTVAALIAGLNFLIRRVIGL